MDFVESIRSEGVELEYKPMGGSSGPKAPIIIEVDNENAHKDIDKLDIEIPVLSPRVYREYKSLEDLDPASFGVKRLEYRKYSDEEKREIVFKDITTGEINHTTFLDSVAVTDYRSVVGYFAKIIKDDLHLVGGYDVLYGKVKDFISSWLFEAPVEIDDLNTLRNLSEMEASVAIIETFKRKINELTVRDKGSAEIRDYIRLRNTRPFVVKEQPFLVPQKSLFNKIVGDKSRLELLFAAFLDKCPDADVISFAKNYFSVSFKIDYVKADGSISNYYPDFIVKTGDRDVYIVETKGREDLDVPQKMERLKRWCEDVNAAQDKIHFDFVYVDEEDFERYKPDTFASVVKSFRRYKDD
jgi:type III restriction enzyme